MVAINEKHPALTRVIAVLASNGSMPAMERGATPVSEAGLRPTVFVPVRRGETLTFKDVAVHKV